ncbi:MAG: hypothetical protein WC678_03295 [Parcubacteria group bacterium]|jgi:hypothetical protein
MEAYIIIGAIAFIFFFIIYLLLDFAMIKGGANQFWDKWVRKTLWIWLPFYALQRLIKEVILKK